MSITTEKNAIPATNGITLETRPEDQSPRTDPVRLADFRTTVEEALPYRNRINELLNTLETPENFCRRTLQHVLNHAYARPLRINDSIRLKPAKATDQGLYTYTLLQAAMLNFTEDEVAAGYFSSDSEVLCNVEETSGNGSPPIKITAQAFAGLSRQLDLGGEYQKHVARTFKVSSIELFGSRLHKFNMKLAVYEKYFSNLDFPLHRLFTLLKLTNEDDDITHGQAFNNANIKLYSVQLFGKYTTDAVVIACRQTEQSTKDSYILYIPNDPAEGFYRDDNEEQCKYRLGVNFISNETLQKLLISQLTNAEQNVFPANNLSSISFVEDITFLPLEKGLYKHLFDRYLDKLSADARDIAVPVANVNDPAHADRRNVQASRFQEGGAALINDLSTTAVPSSEAL